MYIYVIHDCFIYPAWSCLSLFMPVPMRDKKYISGQNKWKNTCCWCRNIEMTPAEEYSLTTNFSLYHWQWLLTAVYLVLRLVHFHLLRNQEVWCYLPGFYSQYCPQKTYLLYLQWELMKYFFHQTPLKGGYPSLGVIGGDSCSEGRGFESLRCILDVLFHIYLL